MPYVDQAAKDRIAAGSKPPIAGELNYALTITCLDYLKREGGRYQQINDILSVLVRQQLWLAGTLHVSQLNSPLMRAVDRACIDFAFTGGSADDAVGAIECCKLEFYRRLAGPYEDGAIARNGDVYPCA